MHLCELDKEETGFLLRQNGEDYKSLQMLYLASVALKVALLVKGNVFTVLVHELEKIALS